MTIHLTVTRQGHTQKVIKRYSSPSPGQGTTLSAFSWVYAAVHKDHVEGQVREKRHHESKWSICPSLGTPSLPLPPCQDRLLRYRRRPKPYDGAPSFTYGLSLASPLCQRVVHVVWTSRVIPPRATLSRVPNHPPITLPHKIRLRTFVTLFGGPERP